MKTEKIRVGITHGDINGVGYEVIFKLFSEPMMLELCTPVIYGSPKVATYHRKAMDLSVNFLTVDSAHLVKQLKNATGISLAVTYPTAKADGVEDNYYDTEKCFLFVLQKLAPGNKTEEDLLLMYATLQRIMLLVRDVIRNRQEDCFEIIPQESYNIEWEYQVFGEHCGLSMSLEFRDYD